MVSKQKKRFIDFEWTTARVANDNVGVPVPDVSNKPWLDKLILNERGKDDDPPPRCRPMRQTLNDDLPKGTGSD
eukprot:11565601-Karenia_brevis.AAC.1